MRKNQIKVKQGKEEIDSACADLLSRFFLFTQIFLTVFGLSVLYSCYGGGLWISVVALWEVVG